MLNVEITMTEMKEAISNKSPGPDGIPAELYKEIQTPLEQLMLDLYNKTLEQAKLPNSWTEAYITLILKENINDQQIQNYRPISLLNVDDKIFVTIIVERVKKILHEYIHSDQNGFIPQRHLRNNTISIINVLEYYEAHPDKQLALVFMDAQKAFGNLNWNFFYQSITSNELWRIFFRYDQIHIYHSNSEDNFERQTNGEI
uniref:Reverse transcriptase domain-containing protein n=1 Tax=Micrurus lemniscatus lemniscatus TaxID=129467 RepID=A0A2D4HVX0_MICLE